MEQCNNTVKVFDGKRRYNIKILKKESFYIKRKVIFIVKDNLNTFKCNYEIERIAGYTKKELAKFPKKEYLD